MKKVFFKLLIAFSVIATVSCNKDSERIEPGGENSDKTSMLMPVNPEEGSDASARTTATITPFSTYTPYVSSTSSVPITDRWYSKVIYYDFFSGKPYDYEEYYRQGNTVYQKNSDGKEVASYYITNSTDVSFLHARNNYTNVVYAFPIHSQGKYAGGFKWNSTTKVWTPSINYLYAKESVCINDTEKPKVNSSLCKSVSTATGQKYECVFVRSSHASYPATMSNFISYAMSTFDITDNCDGNLTIIQTPAPGTIISSPRSVEVKFEIIDNNNNRLNVSLPVVFEKH